MCAVINQPSVTHLVITVINKSLTFSILLSLVIKDCIHDSNMPFTSKFNSSDLGCDTVTQCLNRKKLIWAKESVLSC